MDTTTLDRESPAWRTFEAEFWARAEVLELNAAAAYDRGDNDKGNRLAGARDACRHLAGALGELKNVQGVLYELPELEAIARNQVAFIRMRERQWRGRGEQGLRAVRVYAGLLIYWQSLLAVYTAAAGDLAAALEAPGPEAAAP